MNSSEKWTDPIVDEVQRARRQLLKQAGGTLEALGEWLMRNQESHGELLVTRPPRKLKNGNPGTS